MEYLSLNKSQKFFGLILEFFLVAFVNMTNKLFIYSIKIRNVIIMTTLLHCTRFYKVHEMGSAHRPAEV